MFAASVVAALLALPFTSVAATDCARSYTVKTGDYCDLISAQNNASTYQLAVTNNPSINSDCSNLQPGQSICLGFVGQDCTTTYVVQGGDTCEGVYTAHGVNATLFQHNNPQLDSQCDNLYIGEVVCVSNGAAVPPLPSGAPMPAATVPAGATPATPPAITTTAAPAPTAVPDDEDCDDDDGDDDEDCDDDEDEDDLPFCDEL
ncbi:hypothetical protein EUX98_g9033 [Antrodiella citrinella]|uniref:LysM domain-containing protein n=1 Tax=Antrodiella citrinella TaxID=2447956 RepID=A0A4S4LZ35_9APHY|nr:hypothetical protein EUX98_g9033 [Antrodiella citrinella]